MWCQHCGAFLKKGADKCPGCGKPREEAVPPEAPRAQPVALDPGATPPGAPIAPSTPWYGPSGQPPSLPYGSPQPGGGFNGYPQQPYPKSPQVFDPYGGQRPIDEPVFLNLNRRDLVMTGVTGIVGLLLGAGGSSLVSGLTAPKPAVPPVPLTYYWASTSQVNNSTAINAYRVGTTLPAHATLPTTAPVITSRTASDYLAIVALLNGKWTLLYWTPDKLKALFPAASLTTFLSLANKVSLALKPGMPPIGQALDVRVLSDQNGSGAAIAVALADTSGAPQVIVLNLSDSSQIQPLVKFAGGATDISFVGPVTMPSDNKLYLRVTTGAGTSTVSVDMGIPTPTPTNTPAPPPPPPVTTPPVIGSFLPTSGHVGTVVTLTGSGFKGVTQVSFNGTPAAVSTIKIISDTSLTVTVPKGAKSGPITIVTTPDHSFTSLQNFTVTKQ